MNRKNKHKHAHSEEESIYLFVKWHTKFKSFQIHPQNVHQVNGEVVGKVLFGKIAKFNSIHPELTCINPLYVQFFCQPIYKLTNLLWCPVSWI